MPEAICCCLQTCTVVTIMLVIEYYIQSSHSSYHLRVILTRDPIIMYCLGLFVVVYSKQCCLQTNKYDQSLWVTDITKFHYYNMLFRF